MGPRTALARQDDRVVRKLHDESGRKVSLVGWSLGGVYAREIAPRCPRLCALHHARLADPRRSALDQRLAHLRDGERAGSTTRRCRSPDPAPPPVPTTSIFSRSDGVVAWQCSVEPETRGENIEVDASHCGLGAHPAVLYAIADRLAQPEGAWQPFDRSGLRALVYPDPHRPARR